MTHSQLIGTERISHLSTILKRHSGLSCNQWYLFLTVKEKETLKPVPEQQGQSEAIEEPKIPEELPPPAEVISKPEELLQLMEPDSKAVDDSQPPVQTRKTKKHTEKRQSVGKGDPSEIFG